MITGAHAPKKGYRTIRLPLAELVAVEGSTGLDHRVGHLV
jgi:hypothetical protein